MTSKDYAKHLVRCKCILPQFRKMEDPPFHKFIVFSELDEAQNVIPSMAQCPSCGAVHKIKEIGLSDIIRKEDAKNVLTVEEIKTNLPGRLLAALRPYENDLDLHHWMEFKWIMDNEAWGRMVVLTKELEENQLTGKYIQVLGTELFKINNFSREDLASNV